MVLSNQDPTLFTNWIVSTDGVEIIPKTVTRCPIGTTAPLRLIRILFPRAVRKFISPPPALDRMLPTVQILVPTGSPDKFHATL